MYDGVSFCSPFFVLSSEYACPGVVGCYTIDAYPSFFSGKRRNFPTKKPSNFLLSDPPTNTRIK